jgi:hypothetical protein
MPDRSKPKPAPDEVFVGCDGPGCPHAAEVPDVDGMNLCAECFIAYSQNGKLMDKTKYDEDGEPYMEDGW